MSPEKIIQEVMKVSESMARPVYRGQSDKNWQLDSGALRRLQKAYGEDLPVDLNDLQKLLIRYHKEQLITPMQILDGATLSDLQRLSILQHQGAATGLLDFTENLLAALWFACEESHDKDGRVFVLDIGTPQYASNARSNKQLMDDPFSAEYSSRREIVYYEPDRSLGSRIIAQQSVFVICNREVPDQCLTSIIVPQQSKEQLRKYLNGLGLSERVLFGDIPGLATANATNKKLQRMEPLSPDQIRKRGDRAFQAGRFDDALTAYETYATKLPNVAQSNCLKGDALAALKRFEEAYISYSSAIKNLDRPMFFDGQVITSPGIISMMSRALYYNRGNVLAVTGDHQGAVADFDMALQHGIPSEEGVLYNRGNSKYALQLFEEAYEDFKAVWLELEESGAALAMGNCKVMMGAFNEALLEYINGGSVQPERMANLCRKNADLVQQLIQTLNGKDFQSWHRGHTVYVEAVGKTGSFPFTGNRGNTGNIPSGMVASPGGEGYEGLIGPVVVIYSPGS